MNRKLQTVKAIANGKGIKGKIEISSRKGKRFRITRPDGKVIHFGLWPYAGKGTFIDHKDTSVREAWRARHSKILKNGKPAYLNKDPAEYYAWNLLW